MQIQRHQKWDESEFSQKQGMDREVICGGYFLVTHAAVLSWYLCVSAYAFDCNANRRPDSIDIETGFSNDCNANGIPDECDIRSEQFFFVLGGEIVVSDTSDLHSIAAADIDNDSDVDLASATARSKSFQILPNSGKASFPQVFRTPMEEPSRFLTVADMNGDGKTDVICAGEHRALWMFINNAQLEKFQPIEVAYPLPGSVFPFDHDLDGDLDLVVTDFAGMAITIYGNDSGQLSSKQTLRARPYLNSIVQAGDLDNDGYPDVFGGIGGGISIFSNERDGTLAESKVLALSGLNVAYCISRNIDGIDGNDIVGCGSGVFVLRNKGDGNFFAPEIAETGVTCQFLTTADLNSDGVVDLVAGVENATAILVLKGKGDGRFVKLLELPVGLDPDTIVSADLDGDDDVDLAVGNHDSGSISILLNQLVPNSFDSNGDGVPDECEVSAPLYRLGDADASSTISISDGIIIILYAIGAAKVEVCSRTLDTNRDGMVNIADAVLLLEYLFDGVQDVNIGRCLLKPPTECSQDQECNDP